MMPDPVTIAILAGISLLAFTVAGLAGFGSGVIALPVLVWMLGPREAVPIITLVQLVGSASRTGLNWKEISWPVLKWSALGSIPISALASYLFVVTPAPIFTRLLGLLLLVLVAQRHTQWGRGRSIKLRSFVLYFYVCFVCFFFFCSFSGVIALATHEHINLSIFFFI